MPNRKPAEYQRFSEKRRGTKTPRMYHYVNVKEATYARVLALAEETDRSVASVVEIAIQEFLERLGR